MYTLIGTARLNDVDPQAWLADVLGRIVETPQTRLEEPLPWIWVPEQKFDQATSARSHADRSAPSQPLLKVRLNTPAVFGGCIRVLRPRQHYVAHTGARLLATVAGSVPTFVR